MSRDYYQREVLLFELYFCSRTCKYNSKPPMHNFYKGVNLT